MPDTKITALTALTTADPATDMFPVVDVSDTTMAASGTTKRISINNILACSPSATLASATITGDLTVDTSTLKVDSSNDRVGIGTATPAAKLIVRDGTNRNLLVSSDATQLGSTGIAIGGFTDNAAGYAPLSLIASVMQFGIGGSTAMTLNSSGNLAFANGKGIDFSAVTGGTGTATANVLNDYEEGTFTPTISGTTDPGTATYTRSGHYTKVGRVVTCDIAITWTGHTGTGNLEVAGLPFSVLTTTNYTASAAIGYFENVALTAGNVPAFSMLWFNTTKLRGYQYPTGGGAITSIPMDPAGQMSLSITYIVA